ncbi:MAG TPA: argininosuccinate lyase [Kofleriaceae bacterium]|jgi:argininosuccinate lyase
MTSLAKTAASGGTELLPDVLAFTSSLAADRPLVLADLVGSLAHVRMLEAQRIVPADAARAIAEGLARLAKAAAAGTLALPDEEDVHMAVETALFADIGAPAKVLHAARSRNDQVALDLRLFTRERAVLAVEGIAALIEELVAHARAAGDALIPSYTHRQRAQPVSLAYLFSGYAQMFARDLATFAFALDQVNSSPLGAGASSGTSLPIDRDHVRRALGFARTTANALDTVGDRDFALDFVYATSKLLLHASRVATDIIDYASVEFGFVQLSSGIACGSSMMPHKRNPDLFELVRGKCGAGTGALVQLATTMKGLPFGYSRDQQEDRGPIATAAALAVDVPRMLAVGLRNIAFDPVRTRAALEGDVTQATDIAEALVARGVPFRESHAVVGALVARTKALGLSLLTLPPAEAAAIDPRLTPDVLAAADLARAVGAKRSLGGTAPERVAEQLAALEATVSAARDAARAIPRLADLWEQLAEGL